MRDILARVRAIMLTPQTEWPAVARESGNAPCILYIAVLALIPALARFIGGSLIGGYTPVGAGLTAAVLSYALTFAIVYAVALMADMLAPTFGGERNFALRCGSLPIRSRRYGSPEFSCWCRARASSCCSGSTDSI